jgi:hypothetical protein
MLIHRPIEDSSDCPFYTIDDKGRTKCLIKCITTCEVINSIIDSPISLTQSIYTKDCSGDWDKCCFVPILYDSQTSETSETKGVSSKENNEKFQIIDSQVENYDPFESKEDVEEKEESTVIQHEPVSEVIVRINKVPNVFRVKADVLVYPTNSTLVIDDPQLNLMSRNLIQEECDAIVEQMDIKMGMVYPTTNGGEMAGGVVPKLLYHAVVAGESRLVSHNIGSAVTQALFMADKQHAKVIAMLPFDCGTLDIEETARIQLGAIYTFLQRVDIKNIERIHIIMDDEESKGAFVDYFDTIFGENQ